MEGATKLKHSVPLEMCYCMVLLFAKVTIFRFWPKSLDYNKAFWPKLSSFFVVHLLQHGRCYKAEMCTILFPLRCAITLVGIYPGLKSYYRT